MGEFHPLPTGRLHSEAERWEEELVHGQSKSLEPSDDYVRFAKELLESSRIPFEEPPLTGATLGELVPKASPTGLGALVGWTVVGSTPKLLVSIPAGIIIVRCAVGVGRGLEEGLHARIKKFFTRRA